MKAAPARELVVSWSYLTTTHNQETPVLLDCATLSDAFATPTALPLEAAFDGGRLTSDGGLPWLAEADAALGLCAAFAAFVPEWRRGRVQHSLETLVRQRVFQLACGYADQDDADDPTHGAQEGSAYHGYYRRHMLHPLLVFDGETGQLLAAILRPGNAAAPRGVLTLL